MAQYKSECSVEYGKIILALFWLPIWDGFVHLILWFYIWFLVNIEMIPQTKVESKFVSWLNDYFLNKENISTYSAYPWNMAEVKLL